MITVRKTILLGIILGLLSFVPAASAQAQYPAPYTVTKSSDASAPFAVTATMTYNRTAQGTCQATCRVTVSAQASGGATAPVRYYWYPSSKIDHFSNDQSSFPFEYGVAGTYTPTVQVIDGSGRTVTMGMEPVVIQGDTFSPKPVEIDAAWRITEKSVINISSTLSPLRAYWRSVSITRRLYSVPCANPNARGTCYRIPAAPKGPIQIVATGGNTPSYSAFRAGMYVGPQAGRFTTRLAAKRVGRGYRLTGILRGAIGVPTYRFRGRLKLTYRLAGRTRVVASAYPRARVRAAAGADPIIQIGKVSTRIACTAKIKRLNRQGARFSTSMRARVLASGSKYTTRTTKKRVSLAGCR